MQNILVYVRSGSALGTCVDTAVVKTVTPPELVIGCEYALKFRLFGSDGTPILASAFSSIATWLFSMDDDYSASTTPKISAGTGVAVADVERDGVTAVEITVPLEATRTAEAMAWLGSSEAKSLTAELAGFAADAEEPDYVLQLKNFTLRNRIAGGGEPVPSLLSGMPILPLSSISAIDPRNAVAYTHTLEASDAFSFSSPVAGAAPTFELWLTQPATAVSFSFSTTILWDDGSGSYAATNTAPDMSTADTLYALVFRYDGEVWLGNLAYSRAVVAAGE